MEPDRKLVEEIVPFLHESRPDIRKVAASTALRIATSEQGIEMLHNAGAIPYLCQLISDVGDTPKEALTALINISADHIPAVESMVKAGAVNKACEVAAEQEGCRPELRDLALTLLSNLTILDSGAASILQVSASSSVSGLHIRKLTRWFLTRPAEEVGTGIGASASDSWQHVASVLCHVSRVEEGQSLLCRSDLKLVEDILPQLQSPNVVRRRGIAGCIRNLCLDHKYHHRLVHQALIIPHLLQPLTDESDEFSFQEKVSLDPRLWQKSPDQAPRRRESDERTRYNLLEAIQSLCMSTETRVTLGKQGTYYIIRETSKHENDAQLLTVCHRIATLLTAERNEREHEQSLDTMGP